MAMTFQISWRVASTPVNSLRTLGSICLCQVPQVLLNLILNDDELDFVPLILALSFNNLKDLHS